MPAVSFRHDRRQILIPTAVLLPEAVQSTRFVKAFGLLDTGATCSAVSRAIAEQLDLPRCGKTIITTPSGEHATRLYRMRLGFYPDSALNLPEPNGGELPFVLPLELIAIQCSPGQGFDVLIGMDIIGRSELHTRPDGAGVLTLQS